MNFFKSLFGGKVEKPEDKKKASEDKDFDVLKYDGIRALKSGQAEYAIKCFEHALQLKDDLEIHEQLSTAYMHTGNLPQAYEQLRILSEAEPDNIKILLRMANVAYMMEDYGAMAGACEKAMLIDKDNAEVMYLYARSCIGHGDSTNAIAMLTKAIMLKPNYMPAYLLRGETLLKEGNAEDAAEDADFLLGKADGEEEVLMLKARVERLRGDDKKALEYYDKVIDCNPFSLDAYKERGALKEKLGDAEGSKEDLSMAEELASQSAGGEGKVEKDVKNAYKGNDPFGVFS